MAEEWIGTKVSWELKQEGDSKPRHVLRKLFAVGAPANQADRVLVEQFVSASVIIEENGQHPRSPTIRVLVIPLGGTLTITDRL
jgi:hypothetical protein